MYTVQDKSGVREKRILLYINKTTSTNTNIGSKINDRSSIFIIKQEFLIVQGNKFIITLPQFSTIYTMTVLLATSVTDNNIYLVLFLFL